MAKKVIGTIRLQIPAGSANPSPPVGPALGQRGLNIMEFCKAFNASTQEMEKGIPIPVVITAYADRSFSFITRMPPVSFLLKKAAGLEKGSPTVGRIASVGKITQEQAYAIAKQKMADLNAFDEAAAVQMVTGSARSMGIDVVGG